jgi:hypothetical protein
MNLITQADLDALKAQAKRVSDSLRESAPFFEALDSIAYGVWIGTSEARWAKEKMEWRKKRYPSLR